MEINAALWALVAWEGLQLNVDLQFSCFYAVNDGNGCTAVLDTLCSEILERKPSDNSPW